jgi:hypothetical protein
MSDKNRDYYKVFLVGSSGDGKTYSFRNMNPDTTFFINVENKPLPYKNNYKHHVRCNTSNDVLNAIIEAAKLEHINCIVIDSFSAAVDLALQEARKTKKGFDVWQQYAEFISMFNTYVKKVQKEVFVTGHYEILNLEGFPEKRIKVKGKEFEGLVEKDYTIVLYTDKRFHDGKKPEYNFILAGEGMSAKMPPAIFGEDVLKIPNDSNLVLEKIQEFVK